MENHLLFMFLFVFLLAYFEERSGKGLRHLRSPCAKKPTVGFFDARNLRFLPAKQAKIAVFSRKAKTTGVSAKCIFAFDSPPLCF